MPTNRTALATVHNSTDQPMFAVSLVHKYSDDYKNRKEWPVISPGETAADALTVEYRTGFGTTGRDWWLITWYNADMTVQYYSAPNNFRGIIDGLESIAPDAVEVAATAAAAVITAESGGTAQAAAAVLVKAAKETTEKLVNAESTEGFKQHILRSEDAGKVTTITIGNGVSFNSKSGVSNTGFKSKRVSN